MARPRGSVPSLLAIAESGSFLDIPPLLDLASASAAAVLQRCPTAQAVRAAVRGEDGGDEAEEALVERIRSEVGGAGAAIARLQCLARQSCARREAGGRARCNCTGMTVRASQ